MEKLVIRNGERYEFVVSESIDWIESANNYVRLQYKDIVQRLIHQS